MATVTSFPVVQQNTITPRSSHGVSVHNGQVFVHGGEHIARTPIGPEVHVFDLTTKEDGGRWHSLEVRGDIPPERVAHSQTLVGDQMIIFGGRQGIEMAEKPLDDIYRYVGWARRH
jgi:hypothetical protein